MQLPSSLSSSVDNALALDRLREGVAERRVGVARFGVLERLGREEVFFGVAFIDFFEDALGLSSAELEVRDRPFLPGDLGDFPREDGGVNERAVDFDDLDLVLRSNYFQNRKKLIEDKIPASNFDISSR